MPSGHAPVVGVCTPPPATMNTCVAFVSATNPRVSSINASSQGNQIPVPDLCSRFERSIAGTVNATFSAEFYRDDETAGDVPWDTLVRGKKGYFIVSRFKSGFQPGDDPKPEAGDTVEIWPVEVTSRQAGPMSSNTVQTFTVQAAVNVVPSEDAVVTA